jgi:hypothetical protein
MLHCFFSKPVAIDLPIGEIPCRVGYRAVWVTMLCGIRAVWGCKSRASPRPYPVADRLTLSKCADVGGSKPVPVQMWQACAQSLCRCGRSGPSPGADVVGVTPAPAQLWQGQPQSNRADWRAQVPVQMCQAAASLAPPAVWCRHDPRVPRPPRAAARRAQVRKQHHPRDSCAREASAGCMAGFGMLRCVRNGSDVLCSNRARGTLYIRCAAACTRLDAARSNVARCAAAAAPSGACCACTPSAT